MEKKTKEIMHRALTLVLNAVKEIIESDLKIGNNIDLCLEAYNYWQEEECSGMDYIFNIDKKEDLKYLFENDMITANGIASLVNDHIKLFTFCGEKDRGFQPISEEDVVRILINNAEDYVAHAIMYVGRCGEDSPYANIYDTYVTSYIYDYFK